MKFTETNPNKSYDVMRYVSENGVWEMGVRSVLYGKRISANPVGWGGYEVDYCAGPVPEHVYEIRDLVRDILEAYPESLEPYTIRQLWPKWERRPIHKDETCVPELRRLAALARAGAL